MAVVVVSVAVATPAWACSICRCGDPTFNALGIEGVSLTGLRIAFDWDQVKKTQGVPGEDFDSLRERRSTLLVAWNGSERFGVFGRLPYGDRILEETEDGDTETTHAAGLADPEIYGQLRLWKSNFEGDVGIRSTVYLVAGVKTDWGQNDYGYRYGNIKLVNLAYEHKLGDRWDAMIQANYRNSGRDRVDATGMTDPDTGGSITYLTPQLAFNAGSGWVEPYRKWRKKALTCSWSTPAVKRRCSEWTAPAISRGIRVWAGIPF